MSHYIFPEAQQPPTAGDKEIFLIASGDLRLSANQTCWSAQADMEARVVEAFAEKGYQIRRAHEYNADLKHGFIASQREGMEVFKSIPRHARLIVAEAVWQYSHHVLAGLRDHLGPILTIANWSGEWPGLVGLLNLNGSLTKAGVVYSTIWSEDFTDTYFRDGIQQWLDEGQITHDSSHVHDLDPQRLPTDEHNLGRALAGYIKHQKIIIGVFDEGCMGMYNAIIDDELLNPLGVYKERLSQSALVARMQTVSEADAQTCRDWLEERGFRFITGSDEATELTDNQINQQLKMYIAAVRIAHEFGCDAIGIQYQQGLKDMTPASDLAEGLLNATERPPVYDEVTGEELFPNRPVTHFNEVDEGAGLDAILTYHVWTAMGLQPDTTLHDVRWGEFYSDDSVDGFVWVFLISGAAPASHFIDGYAGATSMRQPPMYFPLGGGTLRGISRPGEIVWSRVYIMDDALHCDMGRASVVQLPLEETERRWQATTPQWPIMHAVLHGVSRDQMMARHKANHLNVTYAPSPEAANRALAAKAALLDTLGIHVHLCGDVQANALS